MFFATTLSTFILAFAATNLALPASKLLFHIEITGLPKSFTNDTVYLADQLYYDQELTLQPTSDIANALLFDILPNGTLKSTTEQTLSVVPFIFSEQTSGDVIFANYTGTEGTYADHRHHHEVLNSNTNFSSWQACYSRYGPGIGYASAADNSSGVVGYAGNVCYDVKFHARR